MTSMFLRIGLAILTAPALVSPGGEGILASPILVPLLVLAAIKSGVPGRLVFSALTGLVLGEVTWAITLWAAGHVAGGLWALPTAAAVLVFAAIFGVTGLRTEASA